jgi:hypothetical protein
LAIKNVSVCANISGGDTIGGRFPELGDVAHSGLDFDVAVHITKIKLCDLCDLR